jgi:hypothetical protein
LEEERTNMTEEAHPPDDAGAPTRLIFGITALIAVLMMGIIGFLVMDDGPGEDSAATATAPASPHDDETSVSAPGENTDKKAAASTGAKAGQAPSPSVTEKPATEEQAPSEPAPKPQPEPAIVLEEGPRWVQGERYTYNLSYETHVDYFSGKGSEVGKKTLTRAQGTMVIGINTVTPSHIRAEYAWQEDTYFASGVPTELVDRVRTQARSPVYVTLSPQGRVTHIDFPPDWEQATTLLLASLVMEFQLVDPGEDREHWVVSELDTIGSYSAHYTRGNHPNSLSKRKEDYRQFTGVKTPEENRLERSLRSLSWHGNIRVTPNGWIEHMDYDAELSRKATASAPRVQGKAFGSIALVNVTKPM